MAKIINVEYTGKFPNACSGDLKITVNGVVVYNKSNCCTSTGSVSFDEEWNEIVQSGSLLWDDASKFGSDVQEAVKAKLAVVGVCCGGCV